ncbi:hypothetical protein QUF75_02300 [Desulfococcaceae bacterium HSG7]|nr:hypothetical protein [Desulfococcaceae bacterium HSG7]
MCERDDYYVALFDRDFDCVNIVHLNDKEVNILTKREFEKMPGKYKQIKCARGYKYVSLDFVPLEQIKIEIKKLKILKSPISAVKNDPICIGLGDGTGKKIEWPPPQ